MRTRRAYDRTLIDAPWLVELYWLCQENPLFRVGGTWERTRIYCLAMEKRMAALLPWQRRYIAAVLDGCTKEECARRVGCSPRTLAGLLEGSE